MTNIYVIQLNILTLSILTFVVLIPSFCLAQEKEKKKQSFFSIGKDSTNVQEYSSEEIRRELDEKEGLLKVNTKVPEWSFTKNDTLIYSSKSLEGKIYVLDFWGTWCPPCIKAMPELEKLHQYYKNQKDVLVIGVSARERSPDVAENYFNKKSYNYIHLPNGDKVADTFKINSFPTVFIINREGIIIDAFMGFQAEDDFDRIKKIINKNL